MISQKFLSSILFLVAALCILQCYSSPLPSEDSPNQREGRFYGLAGSQASAIASAGAGGFGYPGYGMGGSNAFASASANAGAMGYPYGK